MFINYSCFANKKAFGISNNIIDDEYINKIELSEVY